MDFTISLAHFCEIHGPTSIICTQASTLPCGTCNPCVTPPTEDAPPSALYDHPASLRLGNRFPQLSSPFETPPTSPRSPSHNPYFPAYAADSSHGSRRPSSAYDSDSDACDNCTIVIPKKYCDRLPVGAPGSPSKDGRRRHGSPVLRTSQNVPVRGPVAQAHFSSSPDSSDASDTEQSKSFGSSSSYPDSIPASPLLISKGMHTHTLNYVSTSQPQSPGTYSLMRRTCLRTFSGENLPGGKPSGPLIFGDAVAGYTIAYVFRIPDPRSRGQRRDYALIAMAGRDDRRATKVMVKVTEFFERIANHIITLAEQQRERESAGAMLSVPASRPTTAMPASPTLGTSVSSMPALTSPRNERDYPSAASSPTTRNITPISSFLSAKRVDPDGYPRMNRDLMKPKTLAELVGREDLFPQLHGLFCKLLNTLIKEFGGC